MLSALRDSPPRNLLLASLPSEELATVRPCLEQVRLEHRQQLFAPDAPRSHVYFPETAVVSLLERSPDGSTIEVGTAGCEGIAGLFVFLADGMVSVEALTQIAGLAWRMNAEAFNRLSSAPGPLRRVLLRYTRAFLTQIAQTAFCNATHLIEERCARWLLVTHDRVNADEFSLTPEFLALMLGVRETGVLGAMRALQDAGVVAGTGDRIRVVDRARLERLSCGCYDMVRAHFEQLLPTGKPMLGLVPESMRRQRVYDGPAADAAAGTDSLTELRRSIGPSVSQTRG